MATRLFVGNLPDNVSEVDIRSAFSNYGEITNLDLKSKSAAPATQENKKFAFVTIAGSNHDIETCIRHFSNQDFNGNRLYVTRARESFLERLQRERLEAQQKEVEKAEEQKVAEETPVLNLGDKLNPRKRKPNVEPTTNHKSKTFEATDQYDGPTVHEKKVKTIFESDNDFRRNKAKKDSTSYDKINVVANREAHIKKPNLVVDKKKQDSDNKRLEAMKKKSQEFKQKKMILKTGLTGVDKVANKKIKFSDDEEDLPMANGYEKNKKTERKSTLFDEDDDDSGNELNFEIKKQFEGIKGQKVLDLQSRYKSDKRFVLDERFIEDDGPTEENQETLEEDGQVELGQADEKTKQLNILENVLGVPIRKRVYEEEKEGKKNKPKLGMLRFDPSQPEHAKFLAPVDDTKQEPTKKSKKKKEKPSEVEIPEPKPEEQRPEVSKEQFYKVSDTLKEAIAQPTSFSLRSLFGKTEHAEKEIQNEKANYIPLEPPKKSKVKNPLEPGEKNPFVYDSSDSENEDIGENEQESKNESAPVVTENKAVWKESFFFGQADQRLDDGLAFFTSSNEAHKERRELKSLMKKRIYNKERKDQMQMFRKKIGGRKKMMKKSFRRKN